MNAINLIMAALFIALAMIDLYAQQPVPWYVSMIMCLALAAHNLDAFFQARKMK